MKRVYTKVLVQYVVSKHAIAGPPSYVKYNNQRISKHALSISFGYNKIWSVLQSHTNGSFVPTMKSMSRISKMMHEKISNIQRKDVLNLCYNWKWYVVLFIKNEVDMFDVTDMIPKTQRLIFMR